MTRLFTQPQQEIRKIFNMAAANAACGILFLALGLNHAIDEAAMPISNRPVLSGLSADFTLYLVSILNIYFAVSRFGKACLLLAKKNDA